MKKKNILILVYLYFLWTKETQNGVFFLLNHWKVKKHKFKSSQKFLRIAVIAIVSLANFSLSAILLIMFKSSLKFLIVTFTIFSVNVIILTRAITFVVIVEILFCQIVVVKNH